MAQIEWTSEQTQNEQKYEWGTKIVPCAIIYTGGNITTFAFLLLLLKSHFYPNSGWWYICTTAVVEAQRDYQDYLGVFVSDACVSSILE